MTEQKLPTATVDVSMVVNRGGSGVTETSSILIPDGMEIDGEAEVAKVEDFEQLIRNKIEDITPVSNRTEFDQIAGLEELLEEVQNQ